MQRFNAPVGFNSGQMWAQVISWVDSYRLQPQSDSEQIAWLRVVPILALHAIALVGVFVFDIALVDVAVALALYLVRMFAITGFYHRYFSHKSFKTGRVHQFVWAAVAASSGQRGPLWWAAHHRQHHRHTEETEDPHNARKGFWWSHMGWILCDKHFAPQARQVKALTRFPEWVWLDRFDVAAPALLALLVYCIGLLLETFAPSLGTTGLQMLFWGFLVSTLVLLHVTLSINSLAHRWGTRTFDTRDDSRNSWWLALLTLGEGWHNNHHHYCGSTRQGFRWWQIDLSYYLLRGMARLGWIWDVREPPARVFEAQP